MRRRLVVLAAMLGVLGSSLGSAPVAKAANCDPADPFCQQLQENQSAQSAGQARLDQIKNTIKDIQTKVAQLTAYLASLQAQRARQEAQIAATQARIDDLAKQIRLSQAQIDRQEAHISVREQYLDQRVRAMDKHGRINYMELIVTSRNFNDLVDRMLVMQDLIRGDQKLLDSLKTEKAQLQQQKADLDKKKADQEALMSQLKTQKAALEQTIRNQSDALAYQQALEAQYEQQRRDLEAQLADIANKIKLLQQALDAEAQGLGGGTGQFRWPEGARWPISQPFGPSPYPFEPAYGGYPHFHTGIDIAGPDSTPILAADSGIAIAYPGSYGYGNYVIIIHGNGYSTLYGHMWSFTIPAGQHVRVIRGQQIGVEGSSGNSTGSHLHFEIRYNDNPQNPCGYLGC
jgi:murein DD-endopeptidase MepM/ murein hydrolase activator NlpD